jgi:hypothetical protein
MSVYWIGSDGNVWFKGATGAVQNVGAPIKAGANGFDSAMLSAEATQIADPNPPKTEYTPPPTNTTSTSGGLTAAQIAANLAGRENTQKAIDSLDTEQNVGYKNIDDTAAGIKTTYDNETTKNTQDYNDSTVTNNTNLQKNKQNALLAASQGRRGLRGVLASMGALGGDGSVIADRMVQKGANADIGQAADTFGANTVTLDKALRDYNDANDKRRAELEASRVGQRNALEGKIAEKRQSFFQKMADLFGGINDAGNATAFANKAGDLNNEIATKTATPAPAYETKTAAFTPGKLADYISGAGDMTVATRNGDNTPIGQSSLVATTAKKKDQVTA